MNLDYTFTEKSKRLTYVLMAIGVIGLIFSFMSHGGDHSHAEHAVDAVDAAVADEGHHNHNRFWANILINGFFFLGISLCGVFFIALNSVAEAAWGVTLKRVFESVLAFIPIGAAIVIVVLIAGYLHLHHIWHWMDPEVYDMASPKYDPVIAGKAAYFHPLFFWGRVLLFLGGYWYAAKIFRKRSLIEDSEGGERMYWKNFAFGGGFLVFFGFTSSVLSWDVLMSIDTHWFSTMFGWYIFSGIWITGICTFILIALHLKKRGHLENVNENHMHDLGKWMFAIGLLWCYIWFCQYMLIWYSNIPEEVQYYEARFDDHRALIVAMFSINIIVPMLVLMARDTKRNKVFLTIGAIILIMWHWVDMYQIVMVGAIKEDFCISIWDILVAVGFLGLFLNVLLRNLTKAPLQVLNHPFLEESIHHQQ